MKQLFLFTIVSIVMLANIVGCNDSHGSMSPNDTTATPTDLCQGQTKPFRADFTIYEEVGGNLYQNDTVLSRNTTYFVASKNCDSIVWIVGTDTRRWYTDTLRLRFSKEAGSNIPIMMVAKKRQICVAGDDGIDTVRKILTVLGSQQSLMIGSFKGYHNDNPSDSQTVSIVFREWENLPGSKLFSFVNFQKCNEPVAATKQPNFSYSVGYRSMFFDNVATGNGSCISPKGFAELDASRNVLSISYTTLDSTAKISGEWKAFYRKQTFKGIRQ